MKRWDDFLKEEPSRELTAAIEARVFEEMKSEAVSRRWWLRLASVTVGLTALVTGYRMFTEAEVGDIESAALLDLAEADAPELEAMEDLDVVEILEELEKWQNS